MPKRSTKKKFGKAKQSFTASESINLLLAMKYIRTPKQSDFCVCFDEFDLCLHRQNACGVVVIGFSYLSDEKSNFTALINKR